VSTLSQATSVSLSDIGYERVDTPDSGGAVPPVAPRSPISRGYTPSIANSPGLVGVASSGLPRVQVSPVPSLADAAFTGTGTGAASAVNTNYLLAGNVVTTTAGSGSVSIDHTGIGASPLPSATTASPITSAFTLVGSNTAVKTPILNQNDSFTSAVQLGKTFVLYKVSVSSAARVQIYASAATMQADAGRTISLAPADGAANGLVMDLNLALPVESSWLCSPVIIGANAEMPRSGSAYIRVTNLNAVTTPITVSLFYLTLEA
jgi:hypothetical protein